MAGNRIENLGNVTLAGNMGLTGGNVGVGTDTPVHPLQVVHASQPGIVLEDLDSEADDKKVKLQVNGGVAKFLSLLDNDNSRVDNILTMDMGTGNVGIGAGSPNQPLVVSESGGTPFNVHNDINTSGNTVDVLYSLDDSAGNVQTYAATRSILGSSTDSSENGEFAVLTMSSGSLTEQLRVDENGNVGIGTTSPGGILEVSKINPRIVVNDTSTGSPFVRFDMDAGGGPSWLVGGDAGLGGGAARSFVIQEGSTERFVINPGGNIGIGTTSPGSDFELHVGSGNSDILVESTNTDTGANLVLDAQASSTGLNLGTISHRWNGTTIAQMQSLSGADTTNKDDGEIVFKTASGGTLSEAMRIDQNGNVGIGDSTPDATLDVSGDVDIVRSADQAFQILGQVDITVDTEDVDGFGGLIVGGGDNNNGFLQLGRFEAVGSDTMCWDGAGASNIGDCSSLREYKNDIQGLDLGLETVRKMRPVTFEWIERMGGEQDIGFVAEEVEQVNPLLADYNGENLTGVKYRQYTAVLTNAIQELDEKNRQIQAKMGEMAEENQELREENRRQERRIEELTEVVCRDYPEEDMCG